MIFGPKEIMLKDNRECILRSPSVLDAGDLIEYLKIVSAETDYMIRYPEEVTMSDDEEREFLAGMLKEKRKVMISAILEGKIVGNACITYIDNKIKLRHRAEFGIAILKEAWNLGIGSAILKEMINLAREMDYERIELEVDESNAQGIALYHKMGFTEYGKREHAFRMKDGSYRSEILMQKDLRVKE